MVVDGQTLRVSGDGFWFGAGNCGEPAARLRIVRGGAAEYMAPDGMMAGGAPRSAATSTHSGKCARKHCCGPPPRYGAAIAMNHMLTERLGSLEEC